MIKIQFDKDQTGTFLSDQSVLIPFGEVDSLNVIGKDIGFMEGSHGIWGENNVTHVKYDANLYWSDILRDAVHVPSRENPCSTSFLLRHELWSGHWTEGWTTCYYGMAVNGGTSYSLGYDLSNRITSARHVAFERLSDFSWIIYRVPLSSLTTSKPYNSGLEARCYTFDPSTRTATCRLTKYGGVSTFPGEFNPKALNTFESIKGLYTTGVVSVSNQTVTGNYWYSKNYDLFQPKEFAEMVRSRILNFQLPDHFEPLEDVHYGDLAMRAVEKVRANHVNMLEFLKDLGNPTQMIPKLKNLKNLKGLANNYLSIRYGILPTVSDLKGILAAIRRRGPYLDKNGYSTYTAAHLQETKNEFARYSLEQRIKIAIGNEDSALDEFLTRLDSWGFLPTFESVWDLLKYSFVVDWFIDVGGFLERIDTRFRVQRLNIAYATMSRKDTTTIRVDWDNNFPFVGEISRVHYHRWVSNQCPVPPLSLNANLVAGDRWLEAGALIVQRA